MVYLYSIQKNNYQYNIYIYILLWPLLYILYQILSDDKTTLKKTPLCTIKASVLKDVHVILEGEVNIMHTCVLRIVIVLIVVVL